MIQWNGPQTEQDYGSKMRCVLIEPHLSSNLWLLAAEYAVYVYVYNNRSMETNLTSPSSTPLTAMRVIE